MVRAATQTETPRVPACLRLKLAAKVPRAGVAVTEKLQALPVAPGEETELGKLLLPRVGWQAPEWRWVRLVAPTGCWRCVNNTVGATPSCISAPAGVTLTRSLPRSSPRPRRLYGEGTDARALSALVLRAAPDKHANSPVALLSGGALARTRAG